MKRCNRTKVVSNNEPSKHKTQSGRHLGQCAPTIHLALHNEKCLADQRLTFERNACFIYDKKYGR